MTNFKNVDTASFAIWKKNKVVMTLAIVVWGIGAVSHIQSKALPITFCEDFESEFHTIVVLLTGAAQVSVQLQYFCSS